jgi:hypothetical protein
VARRPKRGDLVEIVWADITEGPTANPDEMRPMLRQTVGLWWDRKPLIFGKKRMNVVVTTTTLDEQGHDFSGGCAYPEGCIVSLKVLRRAKWD